MVNIQFSQLRIIQCQNNDKYNNKPLPTQLNLDSLSTQTFFFLYQSLKNPNLLEEQNPIWRYNEQIIFTYIHQQIQLVVSLQLLVD
jgi:hypothetical protein